MVIKDRQFRPTFLQNWLTTSWKSHLSTCRIRQHLSTVLGQYPSCFSINNCSWYPILCISQWFGQHFSKFPRKTNYLSLECSKLSAAHPVNYFSWFLGKNVQNCPLSKLFIFTPLLEDGTHDTWYPSPPPPPPPILLNMQIWKLILTYQKTNSKIGYSLILNMIQLWLDTWCMCPGKYTETPYVWYCTYRCSTHPRDSHDPS